MAMRPRNPASAVAPASLGVAELDRAARHYLTADDLQHAHVRIRLTGRDSTRVRRLLWARCDYAPTR